MSFSSLKIVVVIDDSSSVRNLVYYVDFEEVYISL